MDASAPRTRHGRGRFSITLVLVAALLGACGSDVTPSSGAVVSSSPAAPAQTGSPVAPGPGPTTTPATPVPSTPPATLAHLVPGALAVTVTGDVRVRSEPRVAGNSLRYVPTLDAGTELVVVGGPVDASGYTWIKVAPVGVTLRAGRGRGAPPVDQGWVAIADHDGTPWVGLADDPTPGFRLATATVPRSRPSPGDARDAAAAQNAFGIELYRRMLADPQLGLEDRGVVLSPTSVALALAMARAGAEGSTAAELDDLLGLDGWAAYDRGLGALDQELRSLDASWTDPGDGALHRLALRMANQAFGQDGYPILPGYLERIGSTFGSPLALVDYVGNSGGALDAINGWVSRQTMGRIPRLLGPTDVTTDTRLVLVNAIYLKAEWAVAFDEDLTRDRAFTTAAGRRIEVPTMALPWADLPLATGDGWRATELAYRAGREDGGLSMILVLPDDLAAFEAALSPSTLTTIERRLERQRARQAEVTYDAPDRWGMDCGRIPYRVDLYLPRFGLDTRAGLVAALEAAGLRAPFSDAADFSSITGGRDLRIAQVIHQANIDVDEEGTEAAAATALVGDTTGGCAGPEPDEIKVLRLDRPFMFLLRDTTTGAVLFMGRVVEPGVRS